MKCTRLPICCKIFVLAILLATMTGETWSRTKADNRSPNLLVYSSGQTVFYAGRTYSLQWDRRPDFPMDIEDLYLSIYQANLPVLKKNLPPVFPIKVDIRYPELRKNVSVKTTVTVTAVLKNKTKTDQQSLKKITRLRKLYSGEFYFFSQPLSHNNTTVNGINGETAILDLTPNGSLKRLLQAIGISYHTVSDLDDFPGERLICAGLDFTRSTGLLDSLTAVAKRGVPVLVLPPLWGGFKLPEAEKKLHIVMGDQPQRLNFNPVTLPPGPANAEVFFCPISLNGQSGINCAQQGPGYTRMEFRYIDTSILFYGWNLSTMYHLNPTAELFILQFLRNKKQEVNKRGKQ